MNFLFFTPSHVSARINGADMYDQLLAEELQMRGHECIILAQHTGTEEMNGVKIRPKSEGSSLIKWADVNLCRPQELCRLPLKGRNVVVVQHNTMPEKTIRNVKVVYVAEHLRQLIGYSLPNMVLHPINRYKGAASLPGGKKVALINCNKNKGGSELIQIAAMVPDVQFVGVSGYGMQIRGNRPNIEYREPSLDLRKVLHDVGIVVSFSKTEGYPMLAMEVQSLGLPFFGSRIAGHLEVGCSGYFMNLQDCAQMIEGGLRGWPLNHNRPDPDIDGFIEFCS
jgi:hypothetical protein